MSDMIPERQQANGDPFEAAPEAHPLLEPGWLVPALPHAPVRPAAASLSGWARQLRHRFQGTAAVVVPETPSAHPLHRSALLRGMPLADRQLLLQRFRAATPHSEWQSRQAALAHLETLVPIWNRREWREVRGIHVLVGVAGSGRTTLLYKMARHIRAAGRSVAAIGLFPNHAHHTRAFLAAADEIGISAAMAATQDAWERILETFASCDTLLVHTPCLISDPGTARRLHRLVALRHASTYVHHVANLHHTPRTLAAQIREIEVLVPDFRAVTQADLAPGPGALFALQLQHRMPLSVVNRDSWIDGDLVPFGADAILESLVATVD
jgi:hypothetical protein